MDSVPTHLHLSVGEQRGLKLPGLGTAGYIWQHELRGGAGVVDIQWTRGYPPGEPPRPVGASAPEIATIRAQRPGTAELTLYQRRHWEPPEQRRNEHHLSVVVEAP